MYVSHSMVRARRIAGYVFLSAMIILVSYRHAQGQEIVRKERTRGILESLTFSPAGTSYAVAVFKPKSTVRVFEARSGKLIHSIPRDSGDNEALSFDKDGRYLAIALVGGHDDKELFFGVRIWDLKTGKKLHDLKEHEWPVGAVAFSPDAKTIASGDWKGAIKIWDVASGRLLHNLPQEHVNNAKLAFSPDGKYLVSAGEDGRLYVWNLKTNKLEKRLQKGGGEYVAVAICADGKTILAGRATGMLETWDLETKRLVNAKRLSDRLPRFTFAFSRSCDLVATGSSDSTIQLWERESGKELGTLKHSARYRVEHLAFGADARMLLSGATGPLPDARVEIILWDISKLTGKK